MPKPSRSEQPPAPPRRRLPRFFPRLLALFAFFFLFFCAISAILLDWWTALPEDRPPRFVGRQTCAECHPRETAAFLHSHHDLAMDRATPETVLGDFSGVNFSHQGIESRLYRDGDRFMVRTEGPDGQLQDFEVKYVFGVEPLQQYMVEFDRPADAKPDEIGRLQVLRICWDTQKKTWFYLPPPDVAQKLDPDDDLHWTGVAQRWNTACAECHSTNFHKNFDVADVKYRSTFSEIDVSCEACHGAGGDHVDLARSFSLFWDRKKGKAIGGFHQTDPEKELGACFRCHARRQMLTDAFQPGQSLSDVALAETPAPHTYHCDGQIQDEVFEQGAFLQSRMYAKGIRCTDCHDPHTAKLKYEGNRLCTSCHQHPAGKYDSPAHHRHQPGGPGSQCIDCHMPSKTYMEVDVRRDHSLRVPRPDQSVELKTPNACTSCHIDARPFVSEGLLPRRVDGEGDNILHPKSTDYHQLLALRGRHPSIDAELRRLDQWAASKIVEWYGPKRERGAEYASLLAPHWKREPGASERALEKLDEVARRRTFPDIIRAAAWTQLAHSSFPVEKKPLLAALKDRSPLVRAAACEAAQAYFPSAVELHESGHPRSEWIPMLASPDRRDLVFALVDLLDDPSLSVRIQAAKSLGRLPSPYRNDLLNGDQRAKWDRAIDEWKQSLELLNDRAGAHATLAIFYEQQEKWDDARAAYETAIRVEPRAVGPRSNLSILLERVAEDLSLPVQQRRFELKGERDPASLLEAAQRWLREETNLLARDVERAPDLAAPRYQYALALIRLKDYAAAQTQLQRCIELEPNNTASLYTLGVLLMERALSTPSPKAGLDDALQIAQRLVQLAPDDARYVALQNEIRRALEGLGAAPPPSDRK